MSKTRFSRARNAAKWRDNVVFPTPPLKLMMETFLIACVAPLSGARRADTILHRVVAVIAFRFSVFNAGDQNLHHKLCDSVLGQGSDVTCCQCCRRTANNNALRLEGLDFLFNL